MANVILGNELVYTVESAIEEYSDSEERWAESRGCVPACAHM